MRIGRLFNVLVVGGAALGGCDDDGAAPELTGSGGSGSLGGAGGAGGSPAGGTGGNPAGGTGGTGGRANDSGPDGAGGVAGAANEAGSDAAGRGGAPDAGGETGASEGGDARADPVCSNPADPRDPCGCPCCWASDCGNDEPCCRGFCASGNNGAGCCPP